ncbi:MAG: molybdopterin-dependent oxidoreductase [Acidimicrobiia bacterium]
MSTTISEHRTACPLDCPDTCSLAVTVTNGRISKIDAAPAGEGNPLTQGFICQKVKHHARRVYSPERIMTPLVRTGPKGAAEFRAASWDDALDLVAGRMRTAIAEHGVDSVIPYLYSSSAGMLGSSALGPYVVDRLGLPEVEHTICAGTADAAWSQVFGDMLSADPLDVPHSQLVVVWGSNPTVSNTHLPPLVNEARKRGAALVVIDPRRTGMAARADLHLAVRPGTDVVLAYAVANLLRERGQIDTGFCAAHVDGVDEFVAAAKEWSVINAAAECGLSDGDIEQFADLVAARRPAMLRMGWGIERNRNGGSSFVAALSLWVVAGHFGERGSGVIASTSGAVPVSMRSLWSACAERPAQRILNMNDVGRLLADGLDGWPAPQVLLVQGANPAVSAVDQERMLRGLAREDVFTVVHEQVMTDTARYADVVLPATTHFEAPDMAISYGSYVMQPMPAVIDRIGESRTNDEVAAAIGARLGLDAGELRHDAAGLLDRVVTDGRADDHRRLRLEGATRQFVDTFPSFEGQRARLHSPESELPLPRYERRESPYPLTLLSPATNRMINSMFGEFDSPDVVVSLHPDDAEARGLADGELVRVVNELGEILLPLRIDDTMRSGVCQIPKGVWLRDFTGGRSANVFVPGASSDLAAGACFNDARVEVTQGGVTPSSHPREGDQRP